MPAHEQRKQAHGAHQQREQPCEEPFEKPLDGNHVSASPRRPGYPKRRPRIRVGVQASVTTVRCGGQSRARRMERDMKDNKSRVEEKDAPADQTAYESDWYEVLKRRAEEEEDEAEDDADA